MKKKFMAMLFLLVLLRLILDAAYTNFIVPNYAYAGFKFSPSGWQYALSWVFYVIVFPVAPTTLRKVSDSIFMALAVVIVAPLTSMFGLSGESAAPVILTIVAVWISYVIVNSKLLKTFSLPYFRNGERIATLLSILMVAIVVINYFESGVHLSFSLLKVYLLRNVNADLAGGGVMGYLDAWACQSFNLFLIAICLMRKRIIFAIALYAVQIVLFAAAQQKSILFTPFVIFGAWLYMRHWRSLLIIPLSVITIVVLCMLVYKFYGIIGAPSLGVRRVFFVPAQLDFVYYTFFSTHPKMLWGDSHIIPFANNPYGMPMSDVIGNFMGDSSMHANDGLFASGFAQAGVYGVLLYAVMTGWLLKFVDHETRRFDTVWFGVALFFFPFMFVWQTTDLLMVMATHGLFITLLLLGLMRSQSSGRFLDDNESLDSSITSSNTHRTQGVAES